MRRLYLTLMLTAALAGCGLEGPIPRKREERQEAKKPEENRPRYATPQEVFDAQQKAVAAKDWNTVLATITPESQDAMVGAMGLAAADAAANDRQIAEVLKKYGINPEPFRLKPADFLGGNLAELAKRMKEKQTQLLASISDKPRFYADVMPQLDRIAEELIKKMGKPGTDAAKSKPQMRLASVVVNGDTATGKQSVTFGGQTVEAPIQFKKVGGNWLLHVPESGAAALGNFSSLAGPKAVPPLPPSTSPTRPSTTRPADKNTEH